MAVGKYKEWLKKEKLILLDGWAKSGLTDDQIAHNIGINVSTLYTWKKEHLEIANALKKGKEVADFEVENALFKRAIGYDYQEVVESERDGKKVFTKHMPPDVTAQIFWLKNRKPDTWRDKQIETQFDLSKLDALLNKVDDNL